MDERVFTSSPFVLLRRNVIAFSWLRYYGALFPQLKSQGRLTTQLNKVQDLEHPLLNKLKRPSGAGTNTCLLVVPGTALPKRCGAIGTFSCDAQSRRAQKTDGVDIPYKSGGIDHCSCPDIRHVRPRV